MNILHTFLTRSIITFKQSGTSVAPLSEARASAELLLLSSGN